MKTHPKVSIVIINWNSLKDIIECLQTMTQMTYPNYEVVIVDNASTDGSTEEIEKTFPEITIIRNAENLGATGGNNAGIEYAMKTEADYVWICNNDIAVEEDTLTKLIEYGESHPQVGLLSPVLYFYNTRDKIQYCGSIVDEHKFETQTFKTFDDLEKADESKLWLWSTALLIKRSAIERLGPFTHRFFAYCDDMEYSLRAQRAGFKVGVATDAKMYHKSHDVDLGGAAKLPLHYFFFNGRNEYWAWQPAARGLKRFRLWRIYVARMILKVVKFQERSLPDVSDVLLDGLYCGLTNRGGRWDPEFHMPKFWKKLICAKPYLWIDLLEGNFGKLFRGVARKLGFGKK